MARVTGITAKLFMWFFFFVLIFFSTVLILYINVNKMMEISDDIINNNYKIASVSKKMLENVLAMEENEKKFVLLKKEDYRKYFISAQAEFESGLDTLLRIDDQSESSALWKKLSGRYARAAPSLEELGREDASDALWISEEELNSWIDIVSIARLINERGIERAYRNLSRWGSITVRTGLAGLGIAVLVGIVGGLLLSHSMIRPLGELLNGIRSVSRDSAVQPIRIGASDEFGELASSFNEMAERLSEEQRMRSDFISMLSHEIRTPLTSIRESVNLIGEGLMGEINERQKRFLNIATMEMNRVNELLNRIMQVSYLESGALDIEAVSIPPAGFAAQNMEQMRPAAEIKGISLALELSEKLPDIQGDPKYLQQVFVNLLGNAIKFSPENSIVRLLADADKGQVRFSVVDDGPGVPKEEQPFIFNKYYRVRGVRSKTDGAGLGLSIARHIVEAHGGRIWVESDGCGGTSMIFTLPARVEERMT